MFGRPDGIVTVELGRESFSGKYYFRKQKFVVKADGFQETAIDAAVLGGDRGKAAENLARLVLIELVRDTVDVPVLDCGPTLTCQTMGCQTTAIAMF